MKFRETLPAQSPLNVTAENRRTAKTGDGKIEHIINTYVCVTVSVTHM